MLKNCHLLLSGIIAISAFLFTFVNAQDGKSCHLRPLGHGKDDTTQVQAAISKCGHHGTTSFAPGMYNITRKLNWDLVSAKVDLRGTLNFPPNILYWLDANNTDRVIFIQSQASWFVVTGSDFVIDAHNTGGIHGNGQAWWTYYANRTRADGDGRPVALTVWKAKRAVIRNFRIESPPFWANAVAESTDVTYDGMFVNATNTDPRLSATGLNAVYNTDGIDTYRSSNIRMRNWDITCGDDCIAVKANSSDIFARNITCRGGTGIAIGSLGQYANLTDNVKNVLIQDVKMLRLPFDVQPNMTHGVYFKAWSGTINGSPPNGGGAGAGTVNNVTVKNVEVDRVNMAVTIYQTNLAHPGDAPSKIKFENLNFINWTGTADTNRVVDMKCSPATGCTNITFTDFQVSPPPGEAPSYLCQNTFNVQGLSAPCNATG